MHYGNGNLLVCRGGLLNFSRRHHLATGSVGNVSHVLARIQPVQKKLDIFSLNPQRFQRKVITKESRVTCNGATLCNEMRYLKCCQTWKVSRAINFGQECSLHNIRVEL